MFVKMKRCVVCQKALREYNKSGLCNIHGKQEYGLNYRLQGKEKRKQRKYCIECHKEIPKGRLKYFKKKPILTCSKKCSVNRSLTASKRRNK